MKKLYIITLLLAMMTTVMAQTPNIRYVAPDGAYANDGKSWGSPKKNIQDAINDLVDNGLTGEVWVKGANTVEGARYTPTESTEQSGGSTLYMAFKIPAGITVKGGFTGTTDGVENAETRPFTTTSKTLGKVFTYKTILSGRLASTPETFGFDNDKQRFTPKFYGNTYHVVWFAMNGFDTDGRARALTGGQAVLEGCIVEGGHANNNDLTGRKHNAYGGGIYMVDGAVVRDCEIRHCDASRDGGGVYMDGGGLLQHSYIHDCQALGVGVENGFGGGVCLEGVKQGGADNMTVIMQSVVSNNVGRMGGGLALKVNDTAKRTKLAASSVLVNNNTSTTAAGGVMLYKGGAVAGLTIVRNRCNGSGIMVNGMQSGRAGGLFVLDKSNIANSVIWGNQCDANNNIQYASHRTTNDNALKPDMKFCSIMNADLCDWSGTVKKSVRSLHANNRELTDANIDPTMGYALFENPTATAGYIANLGELNKGIDNPSAEVAEKPTTPINWQVFSESAIHHAGIQTVDIDKEGETDSPAETLDVCGSAFNPRVTLGAYVASMPHIVPQVVGSTVNFYVDPNHVFGHHTATANGNGHSWAEPTRYLTNVLYLIKNNQVKDAGGTAIDLSDKTINIYIKEGTINNTNSYVSNMRVRNVAIEVPSNVNIYGGYPSTLTDTDVSTRNPRLHQTIITGDIMGDFETNVSHLVVLDDVQNVTIDGVQIRDANATSTLLASHGTEGAALTIKTSTTGINIKNVLIANNQAVQGAAVLAENSTVNFENCIFHNNTSSGLKGIIASTGSSQLNFDHCDVLRNVGHASWLDGTSTNYWKNSILYGNLRAAVENTNVNADDDHPNALTSFAGANIAGATGTYCLFDAASAEFAKQFPTRSRFDLSYNISHENLYPRFINPTRNSGHSIGGDVTFYGRSTSFEPHNLNPAVNAASHEVAHTSGVSSDCWGTDMSTVTNRDFGGLPDIGAIENHQDNEEVWENSYTEGQAAYGTIYYVRDYATTDGTRNVVTKDYIDGNYVVNANGTGRFNANNELFDGSSWEYAINGNADYEARTIQLPTFTLSFVDTNDGDKVKYLGYKVTKENGNQLLDDQGDPILVDGQPVYEQVDRVNMHAHPFWGGTGNYANWYTMEVTEDSKEAIHFQLNAQNRLTFTLNGVTYGMGYGTANPIRRFVFIPNYNGGDGFTLAPTDPSNPNVGYLKSWNFYYMIQNYSGTVGEVPYNYDVLEGNTNSSTALIFTRTYDHESIPAKGLQWAVDNAKEHGVKNIRVAAGKYTNHNESNPISNDQAYAFMMEEGVDVLGGYPKVGNPGEEERQPKQNITILQIQDEKPTWRSATDKSSLLGEDADFASASVGRVLVQPTNFVKETKWDGFTIRHGFLHSWYRHNIAGDISRIQTNRIGTSGGAGVYLMGNGVLENCEIMDNVVLVVATDAGERTGYQAANSVTSNGGFHQAGAGVYMTGSDVIRGTIKNCDIHGNQLLHKYWKQGSNNEESSWMYGAGLYMDNGTVFNTVIHNNMMRVIQGNRDKQYGNQFLNEVLVGAGAFLVKGEFYNNTVVNNEAHSFCTGDHMRHVVIPGVYIYNSMTMYNSIVAGNTSTHADIGQTQRFDFPVCSFTGGGNFTPTANNVKVKYSYIDIADNDEKNLCETNDDVREEGILKSRTNIYLNSKAEGNYSLSDILNVGEVDKYRLTATSPCFNAGTESIPNDYANPGDDPDGEHSTYSAYITIPDEDADYTFRVKDCRIDIGAYELNGAVGIHPEMFDAEGAVTTELANAQTAVYYVTPDGYGSTNASDPANAACAQKLQRIIDTAGRFKFLNPTKKVIVKVANSYALEHDSDPVSHFKYYATRTTNQADENVRVWSIIIPRGVEVWGGYTDVARTNQTKASWTNDDNGFKNEDGTDARNITGNPTYFDSYYENKLDHSNANCYHVVTFSDRVFDAEGNPYMQRDLTAAGNASALFNTLSTYNPHSDEAENLFLHMSDVIRTGTADNITNTNLHRAVLDGIFVTGGKADAQGAGGSTTLNINQYGGAAIVTPYAHVRNCILKGNNANNGGALALTHQAIVSGTLMVENSANQNGGALYVFEEGDQLSDGTVIESLNKTPAGEGYAALMDYNMAHVFTSTIVRNQAPKGAGGGIWFTENNQPNVRINSSVFWQNTALDQANVAGMLSPEKPVDDQHSAEEFYPFAYSAIQDIRASGTNNFAVNSINSKGVRFANTTSDGTATPMLDDDHDHNYNISPEYGLIGYSMLTHTGMPKKNYDQLVSYMGLSETDFTGRSRTATESRAGRLFVEVGARAFDKLLPSKQLMLRLFVAKPEDVNMDVSKKALMLAQGATPGSDEEYYSQEGSSFAYPFQTLYEALEYVKMWRSDQELMTQAHANNLPFEIFVARGTYYPKQDLVGNTDHSHAATFAIPEGVSIYGGFNTEEMYGGGVKAKTGVDKTPANAVIGRDVEENVTPVTAKADKDLGTGGNTFTLKEWPTHDMLESREPYDNNRNNIIEPWEFKNQTFLSGDATNDNNNGVYHVVSVVADQNTNGMLPVALADYNIPEDNSSSPTYAMHAHYKGQRVRLDGVQIQGGYAYHYLTDAFDDDPFSDYDYYHGGGLLIDGNRYNDAYNKQGGSYDWDATHATEYKHQHKTNAIAYRDIPVTIHNCFFLDNRAGLGGAISANTTLDVFETAFKQNMAVGHTEKIMHNSVEKTVHYPGNGGAVHTTHQFTAFNSLFVNNEAMNTGTHEGAISVEGYQIEPKVYQTLRNDGTGLKIHSGAGGAVSVGKAGYFHIVNCDFVRNQANMYPAVFTMNPNKQETGAKNIKDYNQFVNTVFWGNEVNKTMAEKWDASNAYFKYASRLVCNVGGKDRDLSKDYNPTFGENTAPLNQTELDTNYGETTWFSAYEDGRGVTAKYNDKLIGQSFNVKQHIMDQLVDNTVYSNNNIIIASENRVTDGPNFGNPSNEPGVAGYMENADWSPARMNYFTDKGSGRVSQATSAPAPAKGMHKAPGDQKFDGDEATHLGIYAAIRRTFEEYKQNAAIGDDRYMTSKNNSTDHPMYRISLSERAGINTADIDMGAYEYVHYKLVPVGDEVDILWVSTEEKKENGDADGSSWERPTTDLQRAIESLLSSRNGHRKEIRLMEGTFSPLYTIEDKMAFYIDTKRLNGSVVLPDNPNPEAVSTYNVRSFTIKGGYSQDLEGECDATKYPAIIRSQDRAGDSNAERWDHLFYIADATQRYGLMNGSLPAGESGYTEGNSFGAKPNGDSGPINTIPIQIDGITFINDQAHAPASGTLEGAAIYYANQNEASTSPTNAKVTETIQYYTGPEKREDQKTDAHTEYFTTTAVDKENPAKLIISKCTILGTGDTNKSKNTNAVYVGKNGGNALIYNTVFHSNYGKPLVAYNSTTINNTFAKNGGLVDLKNDGGFQSSILNSAMWKNNLGSTVYGAQFSLPGITDASDNATIFSYNAYTGGSSSMESSEITANNNNVGISDTNEDLMDGPNFVDPENDDIEARDYSLLPSYRMLNKGDKTKYTDVLTEAYNIYDLSADPSTGLDAGYKTRIFDDQIEIGAYEYQHQLQRVFYVDPVKVAVTDTDNGTTWEHAMGDQEIQKAINMAALYSATHTNLEAYVFVKGASGAGSSIRHTGEALTMRNGVKVFGSLPTTYQKMHTGEADGGSGTVTERETVQLTNYESTIRDDRHGLAEPRGSKTVIDGIHTVSTTGFSSEMESLVDGFVVNAGTVSSPVINVNPTASDAKVAVRNLIVCDNDISGTSGANMTYIDKALIYEVLMRDNAVSGTGAVMALGTNGYAVNVTVEGKSVGANGTSPLNGGADAAAEAASHIYSSLVNYGSDAATKNTLSGYNYELEDKNLNYQLAEMSKHIDACDQTQTAYNPQMFLPANLSVFVDYAHDRDLLGNPRLICGASAADMIDRGAFETWKVYAEDGEGNATLRTVTTDDGTASRAHGTWTGSHYYPHDGSVVYIMEGNNLVSNHDLTPGFLLVQKGASLYGQGKAVNAAYVAVERMIKKDGSIVALPYAMKYKLSTDDAKNIGAAARNAYDGNGVLSFSPATANAYNYSGSERSAWDYLFARKDQNATSECWNELTSADDVTEANNGSLYVANGFGESEKEKLIRFTGKGENMSDYIYTESGVSKTVELRKYDDAQTDNHGADFTNPLDMGWNCFGIPYLVSEYKPYEKVTADAGANTVVKNPSGTYTMSRSHTLWLYYDGTSAPDGTTTKPTMGDGGYYSVKSWECSNAPDQTEFEKPTYTNPWHVTSLDQQAIWVGEGIFTQTATLDDTESLVFYRPVYDGGVLGGAKGTRIYGDPTSIEETMEEDMKAEDVELVNTEYFTTDGVQINKPRRGAIVIIKRTYSNGAVKATKQFVK